MYHQQWMYARYHALVLTKSGSTERTESVRDSWNSRLRKYVEVNFFNFNLTNLDVHDILKICISIGGVKINEQCERDLD